MKQKGLNPKAIYTKFDANYDYLLSIEEFKQMLQFLGINYTQEHITEIFQAIDADNSGAISQEEFYESMNWKWEAESFRQICEMLKLKGLEPTQAFATFDLNHDGALDLAEFSKAITGLGLNFTNLKIDGIFNALDTDGSKTITIDEFVDAINWKSYNQANDALKAIGDALKE
jgi:Ca2+-binding EF-hand superfamily protein